MSDFSDCHTYLTDVSERDKPWDVHRAQSMEVESLYQQCDFKRYAERITRCSEQLGFAFQAEDTGEIKLRLRTAKFCRVRHCPTCQWRRSLRWRARFHEAIPKLMKEHPSARFIFLTVTVKNCPIEQLRGKLEQINKAWNRMTKRKAWPATGWVRSVEITRNSETGEAHPHVHAVLMVRPSYFKGENYLSQAKWTELWQSCLRVDYAPIVNVKVVKPKAKCLNETEKSAAIASALVETLKYSVKPEDLLSDAEWLAELTRQLHKTRGIVVGGIFRQYLSDSEPDDLIGAESDDPIDESEALLMFDWIRLVRRYRKT